MSGSRNLLAFLCAAIALAGCVAPPPVVGESCRGLPASVCERIIDEARLRAPAGSGGVVAIEIVCTTICDEAAGEARVTVQYANGQRLDGSQGWSTPVGPGPGGPGGPAPGATPMSPVTPICIGIPAIWCERQAADAMSHLNGADPATVVGVVIRCTGTCTDERGDGDEVVTLADGTRLESQWAYRSE
ncbi:MAG TPA: hypothetical protein VFO50_05865 [Candidatus Limnocylindrales bacterium]|nr:hypothetical protein [Candidatus Limnocylindrales bacterium]